MITDLDVAGAEIMLQRVVTRIDRTRFDCAVVSLTGVGPIGEALRAAGVPVYALGMRRRGGGVLGGFRRLVGLIRRIRPVVVQTWMYHSDFLGTLAGFFARVPVLVWNVRCSEIEFSSEPRLTRWILAANARLSERADAIVVNSRRGLGVHERAGYDARKMVWIPNGFDLAEFRPSPVARRRLREMLRVGENTVLIGNVARSHPMKGHGALFKMAAELGSRNPAACFVFSGEGVEWGNPAVLAQLPPGDWRSRVFLLGRRDDVADWLPGLDIFCLASLYGEGCPNVVGEAMASGVACVVTDVGDAGLLVGETGRIVPVGDPDSLAREVESLVALGAEGRRVLGEAARRRIAADYEIGAIVRQFEGLYERLVGGTAEAKAGASLDGTRCT